eukprot:Gb_40518 [translate_table: standard]
MAKTNLKEVCQLEHQLFDYFFPSSSAGSSNLASLVDPLCTLLYDTLRPKLIHEADLDLLCELVDILKTEVLEEQLVRRGESVAGLRPTVLRILADVHERLTFRAQTHVRDEFYGDSNSSFLSSKGRTNSERIRFLRKNLFSDKGYSDQLGIVVPLHQHLKEFGLWFTGETQEGGGRWALFALSADGCGRQLLVDGFQQKTEILRKDRL